MKRNKAFRKFKIGSLIQRSYENIWWESYATNRKSEEYGLVISADQTYLYILINCEIVSVSFAPSQISKIKVVQRPYSKLV
tara:strand:+ start:936 stop:1178 length:243 start_codon:yes stop_codon:yes gene_type:complete